MTIKYETLLNAILKLDPFGEYFSVDDSECLHCEAGVDTGRVTHKQECPVRHLRNVIIGGPQKGITHTITYDGTIKPVTVFNTDVEKDVLYIKNTSDEPLVLPFSEEDA